jgi:hypothetical protein
MDEIYRQYQSRRIEDGQYGSNCSTDTHYNSENYEHFLVVCSETFELVVAKSWKTSCHHYSCSASKDSEVAADVLEEDTDDCA